MLDIDFPGIGWGKADELRDAVKDFKTSGKPVYAYMEIGTNREYYLATAADKIFLPPSGDIYINGFAAEAMFYKGSLDKLGIEADVIQIGPKYKNAPDQYTRKEMSDGQREVLNAVLDEYFSRFTGAIAESRKKSVDDVKALVDAAPYNANQAKALGLIDDAFYRDQVDDDLKAKLGYKADDKLRTISGGEYREIPSDSLGLNKGEKVAVIYASGAINIGRSSNGPLNGEMVGSDTMVSAINDAAEDKAIKAIVLAGRFAGRFGPRVRPDVARDRECKSQETGRRFDVRRRGVGRILHRLQRQQDRRRTVDHHGLDRYVYGQTRRQGPL